MKQHYTIVKTEWLYENLSSEAIASFDSKDDAEHYFNSIVKDFSAEMEESYTACNYEWVEDFKVYCYCNEGCAELALLASSDDESAKRKIVSIIKHLGEVGTTDTEKYVDIYAKIKMNDMELAQMVYFGDTAKLSAYFLDKDNEGHFYDWNDIDETTQKEISNLAIWD